MDLENTATETAETAAAAYEVSTSIALEEHADAIAKQYCLTPEQAELIDLIVHSYDNVDVRAKMFSKFISSTTLKPVAPAAPTLEQWQVDAVLELLDLEKHKDNFKGLTFVQVSDERTYSQSTSHGSSRYHIVSKSWDDFYLEQHDLSQKYPDKISYPTEELPALISTLLGFYLESVKPSDPTIPDDLAGLDDHPF